MLLKYKITIIVHVYIIITIFFLLLYSLQITKTIRIISGASNSRLSSNSSQYNEAPLLSVIIEIKIIVIL